MNRIKAYNSDWWNDKYSTKYFDEHHPGNIQEILKAGGFKCAKCGFDNLGALEIDHIKPRHLGGDHSKSNLQILCANCHTIKTREENRKFMTGRKKVKR